MYCTRQVTNDIFWIGADDRRLSLFEGVYAVPRGVSYNAYLVRDDGGRSWVMVQVAGLIARRIVCRVEEGDTLARGERYGMIRFGSRVDLYLPPDYSAVVANGDVVAAGESILARKFQA